MISGSDAILVNAVMVFGVLISSAQATSRTRAQGWWYPNDAFIGKIDALTGKGQIGMRKLIRDERLRRVKQWSEILIPIFSLLIAFLSLLLVLVRKYI